MFYKLQISSRSKLACDHHDLKGIGITLRSRSFPRGFDGKGRTTIADIQARQQAIRPEMFNMNGHPIVLHTVFDGFAYLFSLFASAYSMGKKSVNTASHVLLGLRQTIKLLQTENARSLPRMLAAVYFSRTKVAKPPAMNILIGASLPVVEEKPRSSLPGNHI